MISSIVNKLSSSSSSSVSSECSSSTASSNSSSKKTKNTNSKKSKNSAKSTSVLSKLIKLKKKQQATVKNDDNLLQSNSNLNSNTNTQTDMNNFKNLNSYFAEKLSLNEKNKPNECESENIIAQSLYNNVASTSSHFNQDFNFDKLTLEPTSKPIESARFADEPEYRMNHLRRGYAIIINNKRFDSKLDMPVRDGTDLDAACLESTFKKLGFDTKIFNNCTALLIRDLMYRYSREDYSDTDCFVCVLMSHGENGIIYGVDKEIEIDQIIQPFKLNRTLAGKPKLFFIQACRGSKFMEGIDSNPYDVQYASKIPMEADFLIGYSTISGYYSWRNSLSGSWFIQSLCQVFNEHAKKLEIMQLLTAVNRRVAYFYQSNTNHPETNGKKQVPCIVSMLTKELYFKPKPYQSNTVSMTYH